MIFLTIRTNWHKCIFSWMCCVFFVCLSLFLLVPGTGCNLWLCHYLDYLLVIFISCNQTIQLTTTYNALSNWLTWRPAPLPTSTKFFSKVVILIFFSRLWFFKKHKFPNFLLRIHILRAYNCIWNCLGIFRSGCFRQCYCGCYVWCMKKINWRKISF